MSRKESLATWLPTSAQIAMASERAILAETLHDLIAGYRAATEHALCDADPDDEF